MVVHLNAIIITESRAKMYCAAPACHTSRPSCVSVAMRLHGLLRDTLRSPLLSFAVHFEIPTADPAQVESASEPGVTRISGCSPLCSDSADDLRMLRPAPGKRA
jgi:hypothetical protein